MTDSGDKIRKVNEMIGMWSDISMQQGVGEILVTKFSSRLHPYSRAKLTSTLNENNAAIDFHDFTTSSQRVSGSWDSTGVLIERSNLADATTDCLNSDLYPNDQTLGWTGKEYDINNRKVAARDNSLGKR